VDEENGVHAQIDTALHKSVHDRALLSYAQEIWMQVLPRLDHWVIEIRSFFERIHGTPALKLPHHLIHKAFKKNNHIV